jgi:hemoglobin
METLYEHADGDDRFIALYMEALDHAGMPGDQPLRRAVRNHLEFGTNVARRNSRAEADADLDSLQSIPQWSWP